MSNDKEEASKGVKIHIDRKHLVIQEDYLYSAQERFDQEVTRKKSEFSNSLVSQQKRAVGMTIKISKGNEAKD